MNEARGDVALEIGGVQRRLCLTLGALAEIEAMLGCADMAALSVRLKHLSAAELRSVVSALLRGGGEEDAEALAAGGLLPGAAARAVAEAFRAALA